MVVYFLWLNVPQKGPLVEYQRPMMTASSFPNNVFHLCLDLNLGPHEPRVQTLNYPAIIIYAECSNE